MARAVWAKALVPYFLVLTPGTARSIWSAERSALVGI